MTIILYNGEGKQIAIELENIIDFRNSIKDRPLRELRIDAGGTAYGFDFAMRLQNPAIGNYDVLYLFVEGEATPALRALAEKVEVRLI